ALYSVVDRSVVRDSSPRHVFVRGLAADRDEFLSHPRSGERIAPGDAERLKQIYPANRPNIQIVISDGLNANAINQNLRSVLPALRHGLERAGWPVGKTDIIVENGRVRAGYHIGALLDIDLIIHLIGERPGTGLDQLSAYITYGRTLTGESRWSPDLNHSQTNAVCGIHNQAKAPDIAVHEIIRLVQRVFNERNSGVILGKAAQKPQNT
ncbi:MAG: ethanolamine ammonia-lyase light chain EutC, partial [Blastocatellia bacterium]